LAESRSSAVPGGLGRTMRRDAWWMENIPVIILLGGFGLYATLRAFEGKFYEVGPYLSPFYSPLIDASHHWWHYSPALLILAFSARVPHDLLLLPQSVLPSVLSGSSGLRRGRAGASQLSRRNQIPFHPAKSTSLFLYGAIVFLGFLWYDAIRAFWFPGFDQKLHFGIGVGTLVLLVNIVLLTLYLLSCHSLRHLIGGKMDCFSCTTFNLKRHGAWKKASLLNERHMLFAWCSLISVGFADFYVRMVASGMIKDFRIL